MVSKVAGYYTTDLSYDEYSSHIVSHYYDSENMYLYIQFQARRSTAPTVYRFYGIPKGVYQAFCKSPSKGVFFHESIRQRFGTPDNLGSIPIPTKNNIKHSLINSILPENKKLDALDIKEQKLDKLWENGEIDIEEYNNLRAIILKEKDTLITKLTKKGYFSDQEDSPEQTSIIQNSIPSFNWMGGIYDFSVGLFKISLYCIKLCFTLIIMFFSVFAIMAK
jgi:hypothetical protein